MFLFFNTKCVFSHALTKLFILFLFTPPTQIEYLLRKFLWKTFFTLCFFLFILWYTLRHMLRRIFVCGCCIRISCCACSIQHLFYYFKWLAGNNLWKVFFFFYLWEKDFEKISQTTFIMKLCTKQFKFYLSCLLNNQWLDA